MSLWNTYKNTALGALVLAAIKGRFNWTMVRQAAESTAKLSAFVVSCVFLVSYLVYHYRVGHVVFEGQGWIRPVYR